MAAMDRSAKAAVIEDVLRLYPASRVLPPALAARVRGEASVVTAATGAVVFAEHSACAGLTLLTGGVVRVVRSSEQGREILLYRVRPGESCILTVCCLVGGGAYAARGIADADLTGLAIPAPLFADLLADAPPFRGFIFDLFGLRIAGLLQLVEELAFHRLDARLAALLMREFVGSGATSLAVTHQGLADAVGSSRENVSRRLEELQGRGAVSLSRGRVVLRDASILADAAGDLGGAP